MSIRAAMLALALTIPSHAFAQASAANQVVGTWRMISATIDHDGKNTAAEGGNWRATPDEDKHYTYAAAQRSPIAFATASSHSPPAHE